MRWVTRSIRPLLNDSGRAGPLAHCVAEGGAQRAIPPFLLACAERNENTSPDAPWPCLPARRQLLLGLPKAVFKELPEYPLAGA